MKMSAASEQVDQADAQARLSRAMRRASASSVLHSQLVAKKVGLTPADLECLDLIQMDGPATAGQIGQRTGLSSGAVTALIDRLEHMGLVRRAADPSDRRKVIVHVVPERITVIAAWFEPLREAFEALVANYDASFLDAVAAFTERTEVLMSSRIADLGRQIELERAVQQKS